MQFLRLKLRPDSAWRTPWQSDTLSGMLCGAIARIEGGAYLRERVIDPALAGKPSFVLSDAFPGDWLPVPAFVKLQTWPEEHRKRVKTAQWISRTAFQRLQRGIPLGLEDFTEIKPFHVGVQLHNTLSRTGEASGPGGLYSREEIHASREVDFLSVYVRCEDAALEMLMHAFRELSTTGFGADRSAGKGQFDLLGEFEPQAEWVDASDSNGSVVLSTFQPGRSDPTEGAWSAFTKYGKLGPEFGLENVFKRPLVLLKPGASFYSASRHPFVGRAIPMAELLAPDAAAELRSRGIEIIHYAFGLTIPFRIPEFA